MLTDGFVRGWGTPLRATPTSPSRPHAGCALRAPAPLRAARGSTERPHGNARGVGHVGGRGVWRVTSAASPPPSTSPQWAALQGEIDAFQELPASQRIQGTGTGDILASLKTMKEEGLLKLWGAAAGASVRRTVFASELSRGPTKLACPPEAISTPSVRNDAAFLFTVVMGSSLAATAAGFAFPGNVGATLAYLIGGISFAVLAVGSTAPGLLTFATDKFSSLFPDFRERVLRHEAAHFLIAYLHGAPVTKYSLEIRNAQVQLGLAVLQKRLYGLELEDEELDSLAVICMAGIASEAMRFEEVVGQTEDLLDLQKLMAKSRRKISDAEQQNLTRWAVVRAVTLLNENEAAYARLMQAMEEERSVSECVRAIEGP